MKTRNQNYSLSDCITEGSIDYSGNDIEAIKLGSQHACAEHCVSVEGALFWTYSLRTNLCYVKRSDSGRKSLGWVVSGNRACGLAQRLTPLGVVGAEQRDDYPPHQCADSDPFNFCVVSKAPFPWLAIYLGSRARVDRVEIWNRRDICCGHKLRNFQIRVTDSLPSSSTLCL